MDRLKYSYAKFCDLLRMAEDYFALGDFSAAVRIAQLALRIACPGHVGLFGSPRLERLLLEIGKQIPTSPLLNEPHRSKKSRNLLHVLTYARPIGGDTRFVWRWIQEDSDNCHSVVITTQADLDDAYDVPTVLRQSAEQSGGYLRTLGAPASNPLEQARELRELCQGMDVVVLHLFPYDVVPVLALANGCDSAKTLFINHSDHTFWIGASVAHSVVHLRGQCPDFLKNQRGINSDAAPVLPIPLDYHPFSISSADAKQALGYAPDTVLLLTIATPFKYSASGQVGFLDLVTPVLAGTPQAILVAVGPEPQSTWNMASIQTNGRIVAHGIRWDTDLLYAAADIYLDSVPFSSITSLLEAGSRGIPLLGYRMPNPDLSLLGPGAPGIDGAMIMANDEESYRTILARLINDAEFRKQSGRKVQEQILSLHTGSNWIRTVDDLYNIVDKCKDRGCLLHDGITFNAHALNVALIDLYDRKPSYIRAMIRKYVGVLPFRSRLLTTWALHARGFGLCFLNLLPASTDACIFKAKRWAKKIIRMFLHR